MAWSSYWSLLLFVTCATWGIKRHESNHKCNKRSTNNHFWTQSISSRQGTQIPLWNQNKPVSTSREISTKHRIYIPRSGNLWHPLIKKATLITVSRKMCCTTPQQNRWKHLAGWRIWMAWARVRIQNLRRWHPCSLNPKHHGDSLRQIAFEAKLFNK